MCTFQPGNCTGWGSEVIKQWPSPEETNRETHGTAYVFGFQDSSAGLSYSNHSYHDKDSTSVLQG